MNTSLYKNWWALTIKGVLAIIFGLMIFFAPGMGAVALAYYFGFLVIFTGFFMIFAAFAHKSVNQNWGWWLFEGILDIILGVIVISYPLMSIAIFILFVGVWAIFMGISQVISFFTVSASGKWLFLLSGVISTIFGILLILNPLLGAVSLTMLIGAFLLVYGVFAVSLSFKIKGLTAQTQPA
ncbi:MAG: HdeD family acid-resistance protein [Ignavibacteriae bacterium]|nr:HdeD family acid-resistance protein [Ignavibacteriota bacterium]MCB9244571.1 HdeD family acid-resistance protein [Ignavibacteriales bacterium]